MTSESQVREQLLISQLKARDEIAFADLVRRWTPQMIRFAAAYVPTRQIAEDVVQEVWLSVVRGIDAFEGRSTLRTWVYAILIRRARDVGQHERRSIPFSTAWRDEHAPAVSATRFHPDSAGPDARGWINPLPRWELLPEDRLHSSEVRIIIDTAIDALPRGQREVVTARDLWGCDSEEVCAILHITANHQRVLLHRARARLRTALEASLGTELSGGNS